MLNRNSETGGGADRRWRAGIVGLFSGMINQGKRVTARSECSGPMWKFRREMRTRDRDLRIIHDKVKQNKTKPKTIQ